MPTTKSNELELYIESRDKVSTRELMEVFQVSAPTIHRTFEKMSTEGKIKRVHGGAVVIEEKEESFFDRKLRNHLKKKKAICAYAAKNFIKEDDVIGIDSGTTAFHLVDYVTVDNIAIITNGLRIASHAAQTLPYANVVCTGGTVRSNLSVCVGEDANNFFQNKQMNVLFLTCSGVEPDKNKIYEVDALIAEVKRTMISVSLRIVLLITSDKMSTPSFSYLTDLSVVHDIVCDEDAAEHVKQKYHSLIPKLHIAKSSDVNI